MATVSIAAEGRTDAPVLRRLLAAVGHQTAVIHGQRGKSAIDKNLPGYNNASRFAPWLVVRDLDADAQCAGVLVAELLPLPGAHMCFRVAVRAIEAWLMADSEALADYLRIRRNLVPASPDVLSQPRETLVALARRSPRRQIRDDMVPQAGLSRVTGPAYTSRIDEFATQHWRPSVAAGRSPSLKRSMARLAASWEGMP
jgi:hypothetical protein